MKSPKKNGIGEVVTEYGARVMKVIKKGLLGRSLFDFYGDIKAQAFRTKELDSVPTTPSDKKGGIIYTKSSGSPVAIARLQQGFICPIRVLNF